MRAAAGLLASLLATGCAYTVESFDADVLDEQCRIYVDCLSLYASVDDCILSDTPPGDRPGCTWDATKARDCADAWRDMTCPDDLASLEDPYVCTEVWSCSAPQ